MVAARLTREARHHFNACKLVIIWLLLFQLFSTRCCSSVLSYTRQELLAIGSLQGLNTTANPAGVFPTEIVRPPSALYPPPPPRRATRRRRDRKQRRGRRGGVKLQAKRREKLYQRLPLPSLFLANVRSLEPKMDILQLWINTCKWFEDCNVMIMTETWLGDHIIDNVVNLPGRCLFRADRTVDGSDSNYKTKGGGLCIYINTAWCTDNAHLESHCSPNIEYIMVKCRPFYLPREFSVIIIIAAYIPPDANAKEAMKILYVAISKLQSTYPEAVFIIGGDFNHSRLKTVLPSFHQHVSCPTRG